MFPKFISTLGDSVGKLHRPLHLTSNELGSLLYLFLIFFVCYSFELTNFNLSIDDEVLAYSAQSAFSELGRWLHPLVRASFWPQPVLPFGPYIIFGFCISLSYLYVLRSLKVERMSFFYFLVFAGFVLHPVWIAQLEFSANIIPLGIGFLAVSVSALITVKAIWPIDTSRSRVGSVLIAALGCSIAAGAYQSIIIVYPIIMIGAMIQSSFRATESTRGFLHFGILLSTCVLLLSFALYVVIAKAVMAMYSVEPSAYGTSFINPRAVLTQPIPVLWATIKDLGKIYLTIWIPFGPLGYMYAATILSGVISIVYSVRSSNLGAYFVLALGLMTLAVLVLPAGFSLLNGDRMPLRTFISAPVVFLLFAIFFYRSAASQFWRRTALVLVAVSVMQGLYIHSVYQARTSMIQKHDLLLAASLNDAISRVSSPGEGGLIHVDFKGQREPASVYPLLSSTTSGASFFQWDGGNPYRMVRYMNMIGYHQYVTINSLKRDELASVYEAMAIWPAEGSITVADGIVLVKLSE